VLQDTLDSHTSDRVNAATMIANAIERISRRSGMKRDRRGEESVEMSGELAAGHLLVGQGHRGFSRGVWLSRVPFGKITSSAGKPGGGASLLPPFGADTPHCYGLAALLPPMPFVTRDTILRPDPPYGFGSRDWVS